MGEVRAGDVKGSGLQDLVFVDTSAASVGVLEQTAPRVFAPAIASPSGGTSPYLLRLGDLNGDGKLDAIVGQSSGGLFSLTCLLGNGAGSFVALPNLTFNSNAGQIETADLNQDGILDVVTGLATGSLRVYVGNGSGNLTFSSATVAPSLARFALGDIDNSGTVDAVAVQTGASTSILRFLGNGTGGFTTIPSVPYGSIANDIALGRWNGDATLDVAVPRNGTAKGIALFLGTGGGAFAPATILAPATGYVSAAFADMDGNGRSDLICGELPSVDTLTADASGAVATVNPNATSTKLQRKVSIADVDGDGALDLLLQIQFGVSVLYGDRQGGVLAPRPLSAGVPGEIVNAVDIQDVNSDGSIDVTIATGANLRAYHNNGQGGYSLGFAAAFGSTNGNGRTFFSDVNGDARRDAITFFGSGQIHTRLCDGAGGYGAPVVSVLSSCWGETPIAVAVGTFDASPGLDVLMIGFSNYYLAPGNMAGSFGCGQSFNYTLAPSSVFEPVDVNGDGATDALGFASSDDKIWVHLNNGSVGSTWKGLTTTTFVPITITGSKIVNVADLNLDGSLDMLVSCDTQSSLVVALGNGNGAFGVPVHYPRFMPGLSRPVVGDLDVDGCIDVAIAAPDGAEIFYGDGTGAFPRRNTLATGVPFGLQAAIADLTGDGYDDLLAFGYTGEAAHSPNSTLHSGIAPFGFGTAGCGESEIVTTSSSPSLGNAAFGVRCSGAPASSLGLVLITDSQGQGLDILGVGIGLLVDFFQAAEAFALDAHSDGLGDGFAAVPIPPSPTLLGKTYFAQCVWYWGAACPQLAVGLSASNGLAITIVP
jgi:hypothetical protein